MEDFVSELSRIIKNSSRDDEDNIDEQEVLDSIESIGSKEETLFMKICKGTASPEEINEYARVNGIEGFDLEDTLMKSFKQGKELARDIESRLTEQSNEVTSIMNEEITGNTEDNTEEVLNRLSHIEDRLMSLEQHIVFLRSLLDPSFNKSSTDTNNEIINRANNISSDNYSVYI